MVNCLVSKITFPLFYANKIMEILNFYEDEDKSLEENISDCFSDLGFVAVEIKNSKITFSLKNQDAENVEWIFLNKIAPYLVDGSYVEEFINQMEDENGRVYKGVFVGTIEQGILVRRCFEIIANGVTSKRKLIEVFDKGLSRD